MKVMGRKREKGKKLELTVPKSEAAGVEAQMMMVTGHSDKAVKGLRGPNDDRDAVDVRLHEVECNESHGASDCGRIQP